jgi:hypothetical protein
LDVLDFFASFWIKPKRRRTAPKHNCSVKEAPVIQTKAKNRRSSPKADLIPTCAGPNIHGGAEAWRAGRLDVLDLFASFWIKPKRRSTVAPEYRSVKEPTLSPSVRRPWALLNALRNITGKMG